MKASIFVVMAAYADPDLPRTIDSAIRSSSGQSRLHISVLEQVTRYGDGYALGRVLPEHVALDVGLVGEELLGVGGARHMAEAAYAGEDIQLQVDSHVRFEADWDVAVVSMVERAGPDAIVTGMFVNPWEWSGHIPFGLVESICEDDCRCERGRVTFVEPPSGRLDELVPARAIVPNGVVGMSWCVDVPTDPHIIFRGDAPSMAARLWTSGRDLYNGRVPWYQAASGGDRPGVKVWDRDPKWHDREAISRRRVRAILTGSRLEDGDPAAEELDLYGLGTSRTLEEWIAYSGLDFEARTVRKPWP